MRVAARRGADAELEVLRGRLEAAGLNPSWPVSTTVKPHPLPGCPSVAFGTLKVMKRDTWFARMLTVPRVVPLASM